jgi:hypothetical protein
VLWSPPFAILLVGKFKSLALSGRHNSPYEIPREAVKVIDFVLRIKIPWPKIKSGNHKDFFGCSFALGVTRGAPDGRQELNLHEDKRGCGASGGGSPINDLSIEISSKMNKGANNY